MTQIDKITRALSAPPAPVAPEAEDDWLDIQALYRLVRRRIGLIVLGALAVLLGALPLILGMERTYTAQLRLRIERPEAAVLTSPTSLALAPLELGTEMERLRSQPIALQVIEDLDLDRLEEFNPAPRESGLLGSLEDWLRGLLPHDPPTEVRTETDPVLARFLEALSVSRTGSSDVLLIGFSSNDPDLAARVPTQVVNVYLQQRRTQAEAEAARARQWLTERVSAQQERVRSLDDAARTLRVGNNLALEGLGGEGATRIPDLEARIGDLEQSRARLERALADLERGDIASIAVGELASPLLTELRRDLEAQQRELATLRQTYGDNHEKVVSARAAMEDMQAMMRSEAQHLAIALRERIASSGQEIESIRGVLAEAWAEEIRRSNQDSEYRTMTEALDRERVKLAAFEETLRTLDSDAALPVVEAEILSPATPPRGPDGRGRKFYLALAFVAAFGVSATMACLVEFFDGSLRSQQQVKSLRGATPAGLVPKLAMRGRERLPSRLRNEPDSTFSDALRWMALSLRRSMDGAMPHSIMVTSALPGEGKTTIALALATTLSMSGYKVLLVDADRRRGRLHDFLGIPRGPGLEDVLCGRTIVGQVVRLDPMSGLNVIASGADESGALADPRRFAEILNHGRATDCIVIIDSAPVLAVAETTELAAMAECTLMVTRWGRTTVRVAQLAIERLAHYSGRPVAVAINMVIPRRHALYCFSDSDLFSRSLRSYQAHRP